MSAGSRSGVNWMRDTEQSTLRASARASIVLPTPGHVLDEQVPLGEQDGQRDLDGLALAVDHRLDRGHDRPAVEQELGDRQRPGVQRRGRRPRRVPVVRSVGAE